MMNLFVALIGWRTILFNVIMFALALAKQYGLITVVPDKGAIDAFLNVLYANMPEIIAAGNILLRTITKGPVGVKP